MTRFYSILAYLLLFACGAPDEEFPGEVIGTLEQRIYLPYQYGHEPGAGNENSPRCDGDWNQHKCRMPDSKDIRIGFNAGTCSSWWQARVVEVYSHYQTMLAGFNDEWSLDGPSDNYKISCSNGPASDYGAFGPSTNPADNDIHTAGPDEVWQYRKGHIYIRVDAIASHDGGPGKKKWSTATDAERQRFARNIIRHEMGHLLGLGHIAGAGNDLMNAQQANADTMYNAEKLLSIEDRTRLQCYNEDSGTTDDCP